MKTCNTCRYWKRVTDHDLSEMLSGGNCHSGKMVEPCYKNAYAEDTMTYVYDEGGDFWTGPKFGCVHHEEGV